MRLQLTLQNWDNNTLKLPVNYNHIVQAAIYNNISKELSNFLHDEGYRLANRRFKLFTFSRVKGRFSLDREKNTLSYYGPVALYISSPIERFIKELSTEIIKKGYIILENQKIKVLEVAYPSELNFQSEIKIKMLSPLTVYSTLFTPDGKKKTYYYSPFEDEFSKLIDFNARKKYFLLYGRKLKTGLFIKPLKVREVVLKYKSTIIKGWTGSFQLEGEKEIIKTVYDTGLGSKNSQGFGMFEVV
ncbi:MAG: CRISPR-associated endoribonuclease Cas6 [Candidatus Odinarchaeota archaeon]